MFLSDIVGRHGHVGRLPCLVDLGCAVAVAVPIDVTSRQTLADDRPFALLAQALTLSVTTDVPSEQEPRTSGCEKPWCPPLGMHTQVEVVC